LLSTQKSTLSNRNQALIAFFFQPCRSHCNFVSLKRDKQTITKKAMKKILMLMLGLAAGTASFANPITTSTAPSANLAVTADQKLNLTISPEEARAMVVLRDLDGHTLYRNQVNLLQGFNQKFNISELPVGTYEIAVTVGKQSTIKTFEVGVQPSQTVVKIGL
jgi:hypothetical protein